MTRLSPSMTFAMNALSNELKAKGIDVVNMSLGEPDFNTPDHVKAAASAALDADYTHYTPVPGSLSLKEAIVGKLQRENGLTYTPAEILEGSDRRQAAAGKRPDLHPGGNPGVERRQAEPVQRGHGPRR